MFQVPKNQFLFVIGFLFLSTSIFCQSETGNAEIQIIQNKIEKADSRLIQLKSENSTDPAKLNYIQNIENARIDLIIQKTTLENKSLNTNGKLKVKKSDFDTFNELKKTEILTNSEKYEILN
jgi:hypothetical protein